MKLFDRVSDEVRRILTQVENLTPTGMDWGITDSASSNTTKEWEAFFNKGKLLDRYLQDGRSRVSVRYSRPVPEGQLLTDIRTSVDGGDDWADVGICLDRGAQDYVVISALDFRCEAHHASPKTVRFIQEWLRAKIQPEFAKAKAANETVKQDTEALRAKYKP